MSDWKFPEVCVGDDVMIYRDPSRSDEHYAKVIRVKPNTMAIDVVMFLDGGPVSIKHLWHIDDPRIKTEKQRFDNSCSGVFDLAPSTSSRLQLEKRMDNLEQRYSALERQVATYSITKTGKAKTAPEKESWQLTETSTGGTP